MIRMNSQNQIKGSNLLHVFVTLILLIIIVSGCKNEPDNVDQEVIPGTTFQHEGNLKFYSGDSLEVPIEIEIAETEGAITQGLMHRKSMDFNRGMLFIFPDNEVRSFWMKNTIIPLDIIYVSENMKIVAIKDHTTPYTTTSIPSNNRKAKYVVEVNAGFAGKYGIKVGDSINFNRL